MKLNKPETRIIPEDVPPKFFAKHFKPYEFMAESARGKKVLEIGCGDGYGSFYLSKYASEITGIDYEEEIILTAKNKYRKDNLNFKCMDTGSLEFNDKEFDIICSFQVIEHIPEGKLINFLKEVKRVLKETGKFYVSTLNVEYDMKPNSQYRKNPAHCKEFNFVELESLLREVFTDIEFCGLHLTKKHTVYQRLKKIGLDKLLPYAINPVKRFYSSVTTEDFVISKDKLNKAIDFICLCIKT
ncbi:MAG: class I SAM-dependent methyltransferase [Candidatus Omnitrophota bacterium]